jgi:hypothetical protein
MRWNCRDDLIYEMIICIELLRRQLERQGLDAGRERELIRRAFETLGEKP